MYNYQVDEDEINKKLNKISSVEDLENAYKQIDKDNGFDFGEVGGYQREEKDFEKIEVPEKSQEEIEEEANNFYKDEIETKKDELNSKYNSKEDKLNDQKESTLLELEKSSNKVETDYKNKAKQSLYSSIKQGIARSSIEEGKQNALSSAKEIRLNELNLEATKKVNDIEESLNILKQEKEKAMQNFDLAYAVKIQDKIKKLEEEYKKQKEQAIKYNEKIAEEEKKFNEEQDKKSEAYDKEVLRKMEEHEKKLNTLGVMNVYGLDIINEKQALAVEFLNSISKDEAIQICLTDIFVKNLGAKRSYDLYRQMVARKD